MPPEVLARVFEPFFTTKEVGKGSGLGLPQVYGFAQQSGGRLTIESQVGAGTIVTLLLPRSLREPAAPVDASSAVACPRRRSASVGQVLLVEDDEEVAALTREMLSHLGFNVIHAASPDAALGALANARHIDIVFSDIMMPGGISGLELAREIRRRQPGLPIVLTTGYSEADGRHEQRGIPPAAEAVQPRKPGAGPGHHLKPCRQRSDERVQRRFAHRVATPYAIRRSGVTEADTLSCGLPACMSPSAFLSSATSIVSQR